MVQRINRPLDALVTITSCTCELRLRLNVGEFAFGKSADCGQERSPMGTRLREVFFNLSGHLGGVSTRSSNHEEHSRRHLRRNAIQLKAGGHLFPKDTFCLQENVVRGTRDESRRATIFARWAHRDESFLSACKLPEELHLFGDV
ncbi:hypothetical protein D3C71_1654410 [compost metagenome]